MKIKSIFLSMFALAALASCNNDDELAPTPSTGTAELDGGYITIDIPKPITTRATETGPGEDNGSPEESNVSNVYVATFDANYAFANSYKLTLLDKETSYLAKTAAIKLNKGAKYMFVVLNAPDKGKIATKLTTASNSTTFNDIKAVVSELTVAEVTDDNNFTMVSAGNLAQTEGSNGLTVIGDTYKTAKDAEKDDKRKLVSVDRIVAKFQVTNMTPDADKVKGGTYTPLGWALNVENKATTLYSELVKFGGSVKDPSSKYRMDHNWSFDAKFDTVPIGADLKAYNDLINDNFNVLYNKNIEDITFNQETGKWQYLFENTMLDKQQLVDRTTNIIFKAKYKPTQVSNNVDGTDTETLGDDESYFKYVGRLYNWAGISAVYTLAETSLANANGVLGNPDATEAQKTEATANKKKAEATIADFNEVAVKLLGAGKTWKTDVTSIAVLDGISNAGNKAELCKLRYYWKGVNFYRGIIKHDYRLGTMELGKFGVVRNNAYTLSVESIAGVGEPWIPGPTVPEGKLPGGGSTIIPDEEPDAYIAVTITVNPWSTWTQGFDM